MHLNILMIYLISKTTEMGIYKIITDRDRLVGGIKQ